MQIGGKALDYDTYLIPKGGADIFFPSDFDFLQQLYLDASIETTGVAARRMARNMKTKDFLLQHARDIAMETKTKSGYVPLFDDYSNTSVLLSSAG